MVKLTYLPAYCRGIFNGIPVVWKARHLLLLHWIVFLQASVPGKKTVKELCRWSPFHIGEWSVRRFYGATYWTFSIVLELFSREVMACLTPPEDNVLYFLADGSHANKTGKKNDLVQKGRKSSKKPWFRGIKFIVCAVCWNNYRIPVGFSLVLPKDHPQYRKENELFREMLLNFQPPEWAETILVLGDCAYASKDNMKAVKKRNREQQHRDWFFLFAIARTWKTAAGHHLKDLVIDLPEDQYHRTLIPSLSDPKKRKTFWIHGKKLSLRHIGDVALVFSKKRPNLSPKKTRLFVTNLPDVTPRQVISLYQRRWAVEIIFKELKSCLGLGDAQITGNEDKAEKAMGMAVLAYLFLLKVRKQDIEPGKPWSMFQLQNNFRIEVFSNQIKHSMSLQMKKLMKAA